MKKNYASIKSIIFIIAVLVLLYGTMMPLGLTPESQDETNFSTQNALKQVANISKKPHFIGSKNHENVAVYLQQELEKLGLNPIIEQGYTLTEWGNLVKSKNILARIKGTNNSKALLLLSHYDSAPHSFSNGASDDATGVATILEGIRAFLAANKAHKNDIILLFTDAEEIGLNGAAFFVTQHKWAKEIGIAVNFEARGTSGPSYMLLESNKGNAAMVDAFTEANVQYPVSNSLMYSIYKMLPNDTDLTVFRKKGEIQGYNFAFIDDHFNYHTEQDNVTHLNKNSLTHQGTYLMPLLNYFSNANLNEMQSNEDYVYFNIPYFFISYPFSWVLPMTIVAFGLFLFLIFIGIGKRILSFKEIGKGFIPFLGSIITSGLITYFGWNALLNYYPQYQDMINGFTYNGHDYIFGFALLSLGICFLFYQIFSEKKSFINFSVSPLLMWLIINGFIANSLQGAGFFIFPIYFGLLSFALYLLTQRTIVFANLFFSIPTLIIIVPLIQTLPIGLGLKLLFVSAVLTVLVFGLMLPVFGAFNKKGMWSLIFILISIGFFVKANYASDYKEGKAKPNSLLYIYNADTHKAYWATYDINLDIWTKKYLGNNAESGGKLNILPLYSKYDTKFTFVKEAPIKAIAKPTIEFLKDSVIGNFRLFKIKVTPNRDVNRYDIIANEKMVLLHFKANGVEHNDQKGNIYKRKGKRLMSYYVVDNEPLVLDFYIKKDVAFDMELLESSFDLLSNPSFNIKPRDTWMMPKAFVLTDAIVLQQKIKPIQVVKVKTNPKIYTFKISKENLKVIQDSIIQ